MLVVGGTYTEHCIDPTSHRLLGSGLRAARINRSCLDRFVTSAEPEAVDQLHATLGVASAAVTVIPRTGPITFVYETAVARPATYRANSDRVAVDIEADDVLLFGMVEAVPTARARRAVVDPQSSMTIDHLRDGIVADELVLIANALEVRSLTGETDIRSAASAMLTATGAMTVVVKAGVLGCVVFTSGNSPVIVPALPTSAVMPIGSGDSFSAGFAAHWFQHGDPLAAAAAGSEAAACLCGFDRMDLVPITPILDLGVPTLGDFEDGPRVYIAASFATTSQRWLLRHVERKMRDIGIAPFSPLHENGLYQGDAAEIASKDLEGLASCDAVLVLADGARTGPWVEAGWATRHGIPVVIFTEDSMTDRYTMLVGTGSHVVPDLASAIYRAGWLALAHRTHT